MKPWPIASSSLSEALVPFIFQLPATSGRMAEVIGIRPSRHQGWRRVLYQNQATKQSTVARKGAIAHRLLIRRDGKNADACNRNKTCLTHFATAAGTWVAKLLLFMLVISFAIWGISGQMIGGFGSSQVITAGGTTVSLKDYRLAYDRQMQVMSQQFGVRLTREQAVAFGIDQQVLTQLVAGAVLDEQARKLGLGLSKDRLAQLAREDPAFKGPGGKFDRQQFEQVLRPGRHDAGGLSAQSSAGSRAPADRRGDFRRAGCARRFPRGGGALSRRRPHHRLRRRPANRWSSRSRSPATSVLKTWFEERKPTYAAPEYRKIAYIKLDADDIGRPVGDQRRAGQEGLRQEQSRAIRRRKPARSSSSSSRARRPPRRPTIRRRTGATFEDLVKAAGKTMADVQLGTFAKAQVPDPAIVEAVFKLGANEVSQPRRRLVRDGAVACHRDQRRRSSSR